MGLSTVTQADYDYYRDLDQIADTLKLHRRLSPTLCGCGQAFAEVTNELGEKVWQSWEIHCAAAIKGPQAMTGSPTDRPQDALRRQVLALGGRLDDFDHWRTSASSKPSDPDDIRWECVCGYAGSPETVTKHWDAHLREAVPPPPLDVERLARALWSVLGWPSQPGNKASELLRWDFDNPAWPEAAAAIAAAYQDQE